MHVALTRAEERLIVSGSARMGEHWPAPRPGGAPIAWMAPALVPDVAALRPEDDVRERGAVRAQLNAPASGALRLESPAVEPGGQLSLSLQESPPPPAAALPAERLFEVQSRPTLGDQVRPEGRELLGLRVELRPRHGRWAVALGPALHGGVEREMFVSDPDRHAVDPK